MSRDGVKGTPNNQNRILAKKVMKQLATKLNNILKNIISPPNNYLWEDETVHKYSLLYLIIEVNL